MDAVLGRRSIGANEGPYIAAPDQMTDFHFRSNERKQCFLSNSNRDAAGPRFASLERRGPSLRSLEEGENHYSWQLDSDIKLEDGEHPADVCDFSNPGFSHQQRDVCQEDDRQSSTNGEIVGMSLQEIVIKLSVHI